MEYEQFLAVLREVIREELQGVIGSQFGITRLEMSTELLHQFLFVLAALYNLSWHTWFKSTGDASHGLRDMKSSTIPVQIGWILRMLHEAGLFVKLWQWQNMGTPVHQFWTSHFALGVVFLIVLWWFNTNGENKLTNKLYLEKLFILSCFWLTAFLLDVWELPFREFSPDDYVQVTSVTIFVASVLSGHLYFIVMKNKQT